MIINFIANMYIIWVFLNDIAYKNKSHYNVQKNGISIIIKITRR